MREIVTTFILTLIFGLTTYAQIEESRVKAALIYNFAQNISWEDQNQLEVFKIDLLSDDSVLVNELRNIAKSYLVDNKPIQITPIKRITDINKPNIIYVDEVHNNRVTEITEFTQGKNILIITDQCQDQIFIMVNLIKDRKTKSISYEINRENIENENLICSNELLLHGGNLLDLKALYKQTYERLTKESEKLADYQDQIEQIIREKEQYEGDIDSLYLEIDQLYNNIDSKEIEFNQLSNEIESKDSILLVRTRELNKQLRKIQELYDEINQQTDAVELAKENLSDLNAEIIRKQTAIELNQEQINNQNLQIDEQQEKIDLQKKAFIISLALGAALIFGFISSIRAYTLKKRMNQNLENLVVERTYELEVSRSYYQNLFDNSPISLWEMDLSDTKKILTDLNIPGDELIDVLHKEPELANKLVSSLKINNINKNSLELFKAESKHELIEKYLSIFVQQSYDDLYKSFRVVQDNIRFLEYETERLNLQGKKINLIVRWHALNKDPDDYRNVLVSMIDISKLKDYERELTRHRDDLELLVKERTTEIHQLNAELLTTNDELHDKNDALRENSDQLESTIKQLKEAQNQLIQSEKMASLGLLSAGIAHEINNPINFISAGNQALKSLINKSNQILSTYDAIEQSSFDEGKTKLYDEIGRLKSSKIYSSIDKVLQNIDIGIKRSTEIINSLRTYSRFDDDNFQPYDIKEAVQSTLLILRNKYLNRIKINESYNGSSVINCIPGKMNQLLMNLIINAIDSIEEQGEISISSSLNSNNLEIMIKDNGNGIPKNIQTKIFDPFFTTKDVGKGTGLGLYIVYGIVQQHNGEITLTSQPSQGSEFLVKIPIRQKES